MEKEVYNKNFFVAPINPNEKDPQRSLSLALSSLRSSLLKRKAIDRLKTAESENSDAIKELNRVPNATIYLGFVFQKDDGNKKQLLVKQTISVPNRNDFVVQIGKMVEDDFIKKRKSLNEISMVVVYIPFKVPSTQQKIVNRVLSIDIRQPRESERTLTQFGVQYEEVLVDEESYRFLVFVNKNRVKNVPEALLETFKELFIGKNVTFSQKRGDGAVQESVIPNVPNGVAREIVSFMEEATTFLGRLLKHKERVKTLTEAAQNLLPTECPAGVAEALIKKYSGVMISEKPKCCTIQIDSKRNNHLVSYLQMDGWAKKDLSAEKSVLTKSGIRVSVLADGKVEIAS